MKKANTFLAAVLLAASFLTACNAVGSSDPVNLTPPVTESTVVSESSSSEENSSETISVPEISAPDRSHATERARDFNERLCAAIDSGTYAIYSKCSTDNSVIHTVMYSDGDNKELISYDGAGTVESLVMVIDGKMYSYFPEEKKCLTGTKTKNINTCLELCESFLAAVTNSPALSYSNPTTCENNTIDGKECCCEVYFNYDGTQTKVCYPLDSDKTELIISDYSVIDTTFSLTLPDDAFKPLDGYEMISDET